MIMWFVVVFGSSSFMAIVGVRPPLPCQDLSMADATRILIVVVVFRQQHWQNSWGLLGRKRVVDVRSYLPRDPAALRGKSTLDSVAGQSGFIAAVQCIVDTCRAYHVVVCGCKAGRHRSVVTAATARLLLRSIGHQTYNNLVLRISTNPGDAHVISSLLYCNDCQLHYQDVKIVCCNCDEQTCDYKTYCWLLIISDWLRSGFEVKILEMNLVQPELVLATIGFALEWQSGRLVSAELQNSYANHDLFGNLSEDAAISNVKYVMGHVSSHEEEGADVADVVAPAVAKGVPRGLRPPLHTPPLLPPPPPVPAIGKRERQPDADDDDAETKRRDRRHLGNHSIASSSSASGGQAPLLSIDDMYST
jgi:hypothetical protein